jgi:hypothetical protein
LQGFRFQGFLLSKVFAFRGFRFPRFSLSGVSALQGFRFQGFPLSKVFAFRGFRFPSFSLSRVSAFQGFRFQGFPLSKVFAFRGFRFPRFSLSRGFNSPGFQIPEAFRFPRVLLNHVLPVPSAILLTTFMIFPKKTGFLISRGFRSPNILFPEFLHIGFLCKGFYVHFLNPAGLYYKMFLLRLRGFNPSFFSYLFQIQLQDVFVVCLLFVTQVMEQKIWPAILQKLSQ